MDQVKSALTLGATGMLRKATLWLAGHSCACHVAARSPGGDWPANVLPHPVNWREDLSALARLAPEIALIWHHRDGAAQVRRLEAALAENPCLILRVEGSASLSPLRGPLTQSLGQAVLARVVLGAKGSRWLTHDEISAGAIEAMERREGLIVGDLPRGEG